MIFIQSYKFENGLKKINLYKVRELAFGVDINNNLKIKSQKIKKIINYGGKNENFPSIKY